MRRETRDIPDDADSDAQLDALLAQARWPEPTDESTARLRGQWLSMRSRRIPSIAWRLAAAAAVVIAVGSAVWFGMRTKLDRSPTVVIAPVRPVNPEPTRHANIEPPIARPVPSRDATPRERLVLLSVSPSRAKPASSTQPQKPQIDPATRVQLALDSAADGKMAEAMTWLKPLGQTDVEGRLARIATAAGDIRQRRAATELLGDIGGDSALAVLERLATEPKLAAAAMPGVSRLGGPSALATVTRTSKSDVVREAGPLSVDAVSHCSVKLSAPAGGVMVVPIMATTVNR